MNTKDERFKNIDLIQREIKELGRSKTLDELFPKSKYSIEDIKAGKYRKLDSIIFASSGNELITEFKITDWNFTGSLDLSNVPIGKDMKVYRKGENCNLTGSLDLSNLPIGKSMDSKDLEELKHLMETGGEFTGRTIDLSYTPPPQTYDEKFKSCVHILWMHYVGGVTLNGGGEEAQSLADNSLEIINGILGE